MLDSDEITRVLIGYNVSNDLRNNIAKMCKNKEWYKHYSGSRRCRTSASVGRSPQRAASEPCRAFPFLRCKTRSHRPGCRRAAVPGKARRRTAAGRGRIAKQEEIHKH